MTLLDSTWRHDIDEQWTGGSSARYLPPWHPYNSKSLRPVVFSNHSTRLPACTLYALYVVYMGQANKLQLLLMNTARSRAPQPLGSLRNGSKLKLPTARANFALCRAQDRTSSNRRGTRKKKGKKEKRKGHGPKKYKTWTNVQYGATPRTGLLVPVPVPAPAPIQFASATHPCFLPTTPLSVVSSLKQDKETKPRQPSLQIPSHPVQFDAVHANPIQSNLPFS